MATSVQTVHTSSDVLRVSDLAIDSIRGLLARFQLEIVLLAHDAVIVGSFWGEPEAGLVGCTPMQAVTISRSPLSATCRLNWPRACPASPANG
jgi:hypothetical protein